MRISIAMATYNGAAHIQQQLESFLSQTYPPDEVVVCDDCSTDETIEILESFRESAPFTVAIHRNEKNLGYTKNFEKALQNCSGELIFLSDQDDVWFPNKVERVTDVFLAHPDKLLVIHDGELVDENLVSHGATKLRQIKKGYGTDKSFVTGALTAIRSSFLPYIIPIPLGIIGHDRWIHNLARLVKTRIVIDQALQLIRRHSSNTSTWVASSVHRISWWDVLRSQLETPAANGYLERLRMNEASQTRLRNTTNNDDLFSTEVISEAINYLIREQKALLARESLLGQKSFNRKVLSVQLLLRNDYRFFDGYKSFFRDIAR